METRTPLVDLAVGLYVIAAAFAAMFSVGWAIAPFEKDTTHTLVLIGLATIALVAGASMARAFWAGNSSRARPTAVVSLVSLAIWVVALPPG